MVVKVGGSLIDWPELPDRLRDILGDLASERVVLIVGGGRFADGVRELDRLHSLGEERSHALALHALDVTAQALASLLPGLVVTEHLENLEEVWERGRIPILAPRRFLDADDRSSDPLPHAWTTTSDSIAARVAVRLGVSRLILLKSAPLPSGCTREDAARLGLVDSEFPKASKRLPAVNYVNLRDPIGPGSSLLSETDPRES
jgi:aspartokinase-like uncharacterized kinase